MRPLQAVGEFPEEACGGDRAAFAARDVREVREIALQALGVLLALALTLGLLPLAFHLLPGLSEVDVAGVPLGWLLLGVLVYPALVGLGWVYVRRAERNERDFAELLDEAER